MPVAIPSCYGLILRKNAKTEAYISQCIGHDMARGTGSYVNQDERLYACSIAMNPMDAEFAVKALTEQGMTQGEDFVVTTSTEGVWGEVPAWLQAMPEQTAQGDRPPSMYVFKESRPHAVPSATSTFTPPTPDYLTAVKLLREAKRLASFSGAGLSKASGIPTYRDAGGLWTVEGNMRFASAETLRTDPAAFQEFWLARQAEMRTARPNAAHFALAELGHRLPEVRHVTQNVDGLLPMAGCFLVYELHGSLQRYRCDSCGAGPFPPTTACPSCGAVARPDVVMFGETLPQREFAEAELAMKLSDVCLVIGTQGKVQPAAGLVSKAATRGSRVVIVNPQPSELDALADVVIRDVAERALPHLVELLR